MPLAWITQEEHVVMKEMVALTSCPVAVLLNKCWEDSSGSRVPVTDGFSVEKEWTHLMLTAIVLDVNGCQCSRG